MVAPAVQLVIHILLVELDEEAASFSFPNPLPSIDAATRCGFDEDVDAVRVTCWVALRS